MNATATGNAPVMGERARAACRMQVDGEKRRKLFILLCAYGDANGGVCNPPTDEMLRRVPAIGGAQKLYGLLRRLEADGLIHQRTRRDGPPLGFDIYLDPEGSE